jgi:hypothetical protein
MKKIFSVIVAFLIFSCLNDKNSPLETNPFVIDTTNIVPPPIASINCSPDTVYFQQTILPLLSSNCAMSGCHDVISRKDGVILTNYTNIIREVNLKSPSSSDLYKCLNEKGEDRMPPAPASEFSSTNKAYVLKWIQQGAKNNACINSSINCITTGISFSSTIFPIMKSYCTGCHSGNSPSAGIDLNTYANVKNYAANGRLYGSISHSAGFKAMPSSTLKLGSCEITQIQSWITEGMLNN